MEHKHWALDSRKANAKHLQIISGNNSYSLTVTLNPRYNHYDVVTQYKDYTRELIKLMKEIGPFYSEMMLTPEFTKDHNIHFHCYIDTKYDPFVFEQMFKQKKLPYKMIGINYKLKKIDSVTPELIKYPFKDTMRTTMYAEATFNNFQPTHIYLRPRGNIMAVVNHDSTVFNNAFINKVKQQKYNNRENII